MKTKLFAIFVAALMGLGTVTASAEKTTSKGCSPGGQVTIVKGDIFDWGYDGTWDMVTFGVIGPRWATINYVELTDMDGNLIGKIDYCYYLGGYGINWYGVQLGKHGIEGDFLMKIHISTRWGGVATTDYTGIKAADPGAGEPKDPEETVIVVKWP